MLQIELEKMYTFTVEGNTLTEEGIRAVYMYIVSHYRDRYLSDLYNSEYFEWKLESKTGEYRGKLLTQLSKYLAVKKQITLTALEKQEIGNIINKHKPVPEDYKFKFTNQFNWNAGDFGDAGSCFWGERTEAKDIMLEHGSQAICLYDPYEEDLKGMARAWVTPFDDYIVVWNGYSGHRWGDSTKTIVLMLGQFFKLPTKRITLENNGLNSGTIYINGGRGYIIGEQEIVDEIDDIDFGWQADEYTCDRCDRMMAEDSCYWVGDECLCEDCYGECATSCSLCDDAIYLDDANVIGYEYCCDHCANEIASRCDHCGELEWNDDIYVVDGEESWCEDCIRDDAYQCENCGEFFTTVTEHNTKGALCDECYKEAMQEEEGDDIMKLGERSDGELDSAGTGVLKREIT